MAAPSIELAIDIEAPMQAVWDALTEPAQLRRWLAPEVRSGCEPGAERVIAWAPGVETVERIERWSPPFELETSAPVHEAVARQIEPADRAAHARIRTSWGLSPARAGVRVRLQQTGYGSGPVWQRECDAASTGWHVHLRSLRHTLTWYSGRPVQGLTHLVFASLPAADTWQRVLGPRGIAARGSVYGLGEGDPFELETSSGERLSGFIDAHVPERVVSLRLENQDHALWGCSLRPVEENTIVIWSMLVSDRSGEPAEAIKTRWQQLFDRAFSDAAGAAS